MAYGRCADCDDRLDAYDIAALRADNAATGYGANGWPVDNEEATDLVCASCLDWRNEQLFDHAQRESGYGGASYVGKMR